MKLAARETEGERNAEPELRRRVGTENAGRRIDALCPRRGRSRPVLEVSTESMQSQAAARIPE